MAKVQVIATAVGFDGTVKGGILRNPGDTFFVDESVFAKRQRFTADDKGNKKPSGFYDPPSWFKRADKGAAPPEAEQGDLGPDEQLHANDLA